MKKLTTTLLLTTLVIGGLTVAGTSMARYGDDRCGAGAMQGRMHGPGRMAEFGHAKGPGAITRLERSLDLSQEQRTAIREIMKSARTEGRVYRDALSDNRLALHDLMQAAELNEQELRSLMKVKADNMAELMLLHARTNAAIREQLTGAQREKMAELGQSRGFGQGFNRRW